MRRVLKDFTKVYQMLGDDASRDIYLNKLNWLISSDYTYIQTGKSYCMEPGNLHHMSSVFGVTINDSLDFAVEQRKSKKKDFGVILL